MNIILKKIGDGRTQVIVEVDDATVTPLKEEVIQELGSKIEIQGFRPGKAPADKIRRQIPEQNIHEEVVRRLMPDAMKEIIETHELKPIIRPNVELSTLTPFTLQVTVVEKPAVKVLVKKIKLPKTPSVPVPSNEKDKKQVRSSVDPTQEEEAKLLDLIAEFTKVELAPELIDDEIRDVVQQHAQRLQKYGMDLEQWLKQTGKTFENLINEIRPDAEKRLKIRFGVGQLIEDWKITVADEEVETAVKELMKPLKDEERAQLEPLYKPGEHPFEQCRFQKKIEKVMEKFRKK